MSNEDPIKNIKIKLKTLRKGLTALCHEDDTSTIATDDNYRDNFVDYNILGATSAIAPSNTLAPGTATSAPTPTILPSVKVNSLKDLNEKYIKHIKDNIKLTKAEVTDALEHFSKDALKQYEYGKIKLPKNYKLHFERHSSAYGSHYKMLRNMSIEKNKSNKSNLTIDKIGEMYESCFVIPYLLYSNQFNGFSLTLKIDDDGKGTIDSKTQIPIFKFETELFKPLEIIVDMTKDTKSMSGWNINIGKFKNSQSNPKVFFDLNVMQAFSSREDKLKKLVGKKVGKSEINEFVDKLLRNKTFLIKKKNQKLESLRQDANITGLINQRGGTRKLKTRTRGTRKI